MVPPLGRAWQLWSARRFPWQRPAHWAASHRLGHSRASLGYSIRLEGRPPPAFDAQARILHADVRGAQELISRASGGSRRSPTDLPSTILGNWAARRAPQADLPSLGEAVLRASSPLSTPRIYYPSDLLYPLGSTLPLGSRISTL